mmetsp:Transcript_24181/g.69580  ORF Transcript_24181/g.69580 Transcript_24181/m.69580 type:complete len:128 (-) Transcript_24181:34-417(-)
MSSHRPPDWYIPFYRVNTLRVLGEDKEGDDLSNNEGGLGSRYRYVLDPSETEEPTETEDYYDVDLEDDNVTDVVVRKSWMQLLSDNLARFSGSEDDAELPSLKSYSSSSLSSDSPSSSPFPSTRIEL